MNQSADRTSLGQLTTESVNTRSMQIDTLSPLELVDLINQEDQTVAVAVSAARLEIAKAIEIVEATIRAGGRLFYIGAGTSGRLGVLDASECPPTFRTPPELIVGIIAGGDTALRTAVEGAEDSLDLAESDLRRFGLSEKDCVMGIATSGRTPYVLGGLRYARSIGCRTLGHSCNHLSPLADVCDVLITTVVGPEIISGSTRMKSGTATKLVLNTITTSAMIRLGKTYGNLMVDLRATNSKLIARSIRLIQMLTGLSHPDAETMLRRADGEVKTAVVMHHLGVNAAKARNLLTTSCGQLRAVVGDLQLIQPSA